MMRTDTALPRAQVYSFLAAAFLYPDENWTDDLPLLREILQALDVKVELQLEPLEFTRLQAEYRRTFGVTGSLCYETECGLPDEFRQAQELADLAGFYRAFGFTMGGPVRERPDHLAVELEFMHVLALKEAYAAEKDILEHIEICADAQGKFLEEHLGQWIGLFAQGLAIDASDGPYVTLAHFAAAFVNADAARLGVKLGQPRIEEIKLTPFDADYSCAGCALAGGLQELPGGSP